MIGFFGEVAAHAGVKEQEADEVDNCEMAVTGKGGVGRLQSRSEGVEIGYPDICGGHFAVARRMTELDEFYDRRDILGLPECRWELLHKLFQGRDLLVRDEVGNVSLQTGKSEAPMRMRRVRLLKKHSHSAFELCWTGAAPFILFLPLEKGHESRRCAYIVFHAHVVRGADVHFDKPCIFTGLLRKFIICRIDNLAWRAGG